MIDQLIRPRARAGLRGQARKGVGDLPLFERLAVIAIHVVIAIDDGHMTFRFELLLEAINAVRGYQCSLSFRAPDFGARNLLFRSPSKKQIPRFSTPDSLGMTTLRAL